MKFPTLSILAAWELCSGWVVASGFESHVCGSTKAGSCFQVLGDSTDGGEAELTPTGSGNLVSVAALPPRRFKFRLNAGAAHVGVGDYIGLSREPKWTASFLQLELNNAQNQRDFEVDLNGYRSGTELFLMYFSPTDNWTIKSIMKIVVGHYISLAFKPEDEESFLGNPGTGFMQLNTTSTANLITPNIPRGRTADSLVWWSICLNNGEANNDVLPMSLLIYLDTTMRLFRAQGKQVQIRFWYNKEPTINPVPESEPVVDRIIKHQAQLAAIMRKYPAAISGIDAGLLGSFGEWHSSRFGEINEIPYAAQLGQLQGEKLNTALSYKKVLDTWHNLFSNERDPPIYVRRHFHKKLLTTDLEFSRRTNYHVDCFLASSSDVGTFVSEGTASIQYGDKTYQLTGMNERLDFAKQTDASVIGETCFNADSTQLRLGCEAALAEFKVFHWSAINTLWYKPFLDSWSAGGCLKKIRASLGYRWLISEMAVELTKDQSWISRLQFRVQNIGWSAPPNDKAFFLVLIPSGSSSREAIKVRLDTIQGWVPSKSWPLSAEQTIYLPDVPPPNNSSLVLPGAYKTMLEVVEPSCVDNAEHCPSKALWTRLAMKEGEFYSFNEETGLNDLHLTIYLDTQMTSNKIG